MAYFTKRTGPSGNPLAPVFTLHRGKKGDAKSKALGKKMSDGGWVGKNAGGSHAKFHYKDKI